MFSKKKERKDGIIYTNFQFLHPWCIYETIFNVNSLLHTFF